MYTFNLAGCGTKGMRLGPPQPANTAKTNKKGQAALAGSLALESHPRQLSALTYLLDSSLYSHVTTNHCSLLSDYMHSSCMG